ncbi:MAG: family 10 glycosylhydrolase, partial [Butyricimonas faecalis]
SGSNTNGLQNYDNLYADITLWAKKKWIDYNIPQIYWEIGHPAADYITLAKWWDKNAHDIHLYIGQDVARTMKASDLTRKMELSRSLHHVKGNCFWPANEIVWNTDGIADSLQEHYHKTPALIPAYTHMHNGRPKKKPLLSERTEKGYTVKWFAREDRKDPGIRNTL